YGYIPTFGVAIVFLTLFAMSTLLHAAQAVYFDMLWLLPAVCLCGIGELVGWSGRLWSSFAPALNEPYIIQMTTTIIAPTPLITVNFILLRRIISRVGPSSSRPTLKAYTRIFHTCDIIALVLQGLGAATTVSSHRLASQKLAKNLMLGGLILQFVALCAYTTCSLGFLRNSLVGFSVGRTLPSADGGAERRVLDSRLPLMVGAIGFSTLVLSIRCMYRIVDLADGWNGTVLTTELYFNVLDGGMVLLALFTMNIAHPGLLLETESGEDDDDDRKPTSLKEIP
ncbi:RTA1-like protein, partial [Mycena capillaripes]